MAIKVDLISLDFKVNDILNGLQNIVSNIDKLEEEIKTLKQRVSMLELPNTSDSILKDLNLLEGRIDNNRDRINKLEFKYRVTEKRLC